MAHGVDNRTDPPSADTRAVAGLSPGRLLVTCTEAAEMLGIGRTSLYKLVWSGKLNPGRIGRSVRFTCAELDAFVASLSGDAR
jgi:excisionase family DNA binding protein